MLPIYVEATAKSSSRQVHYSIGQDSYTFWRASAAPLSLMLHPQNSWRPLPFLHACRNTGSRGQKTERAAARRAACGLCWEGGLQREDESVSFGKELDQLLLEWAQRPRNAVNGVQR